MSFLYNFKPIWANTDFPYMCLKDEIRTKTFREAIHKTVKKGDTVLDVGSGSGILSFFAAEAGAKKVYAVEIEHTLALQLKESIRLNKLENIVEVIEGDINKVSLPKNIDVLIAEIIDTGLLDELQVPAINNLKKRGIITKFTRLLPSHYKTYLQLVYSSNKYYGYKIAAPKHEWPFYSKKDANWYQTHIYSVSNKVEIVSTDFSLDHVNEHIEKKVIFNLEKGKIANAVRLSGIITLSNNLFLGPTNALNGDKIFYIEPIKYEKNIHLKVSYKMGGGLGTLQIERLNNPKDHNFKQIGQVRNILDNIFLTY